MKLIVISLFFFFSYSSYAKLNVVTTTTNLKALVEIIGKEKVEVTSIAKGSQDPHFLEAKPSYMLNLARADLLIEIGLGLEEAWLPLLIRGAKNPKLRPNQSGHLFASEKIQIIEKVETVSRADGDVHPDGNPHFMLDPLLAITAGENIATKLSELDPINKDFYLSNLANIRLELKLMVERAIKAFNSKGIRVVAHHKTLNYFFNRFNIKQIGYIEPKPGVPPSAHHILGLSKKVSSESPQFVVVENYYDPSMAKKLTQLNKNVQLLVVPVAVGGSPEAMTLKKLYEQLITAFLGDQNWM